MENPILPPTASTRILFVGDLHLGRLPAHAPVGLDARTLGPEAAWNGIVRWACDSDHGIHAVALAGDVVDGDNALFEAYGPLEKGIGDLIAAGLEVCAVAGNHDTQTLPRLARVLARGFHLLGPKGTWSEHVVSPEGRPSVRLVGWSFPRDHWDRSPLETRPPAPLPGVTTLGLLHADLAGGTSRYAPVTPGDLRAVGYQAWFLGHVHRPDPPTADGTPFYLGSASPLDPSETGVHGPMLVEVGPDGSISRERIPLAPLRWAHLDVSCSRDPSDTAATVLGAMVEHARGQTADPGPLRALGFRIRLTGTSHDPHAQSLAVEKLESQELVAVHGPVSLFADRVECAVTAAYDLAALARSDDPVGLLARQVLVLEDPRAAAALVPDSDRLAASLLDEAEERWKAIVRQGAFRQVGLEPEGREEVRATLRLKLAEAGRRALDAIMSGRRGDDAPA